MKVLYLIHSFYPETQAGTEKFILNLSSSMRERGHEVNVITYSSYADELYDESVNGVLIRRFQYEDIQIIAYKFQQFSRLESRSLVGDKLKDFAKYVLQKEEPDLIHIGHLMKTVGFVDIAHKLGIPYIITLTDYFLICPRCHFLNSKQQICGVLNGKRVCEKCCPALKNSIKSRLKRAEFILRNAKSITAVSKFVKNVFEKEFGDLNIRVINHGVDYENIKKDQKTYEKGEQITFGYAGSLVYHKGIIPLIRAVSRLDNSAKFKIYGVFAPPEVENLFKMHGMHNVKICGTFSNSELGDVISNLDVVVIPSMCHETYCLVLYEALACNIPVIASNMGALPEGVKDGETGFLFEKGDADQLVNIMSRIIEKPEILNSLKKNIVDKKIFTVKDEAKKYNKLYKDCIM